MRASSSSKSSISGSLPAARMAGVHGSSSDVLGARGRRWQPARRQRSGSAAGAVRARAACLEAGERAAKAQPKQPTRRQRRTLPRPLLVERDVDDSRAALAPCSPRAWPRSGHRRALSGRAREHPERPSRSAAGAETDGGPATAAGRSSGGCYRGSPRGPPRRPCWSGAIGRIAHAFAPGNCARARKPRSERSNSSRATRSREPTVSSGSASRPAISVTVISSSSYKTNTARCSSFMGSKISSKSRLACKSSASCSGPDLASPSPSREREPARPRFSPRRRLEATRSAIAKRKRFSVGGRMARSLRLATTNTSCAPSSASAGDRPKRRRLRQTKSK